MFIGGFTENEVKDLNADDLQYISTEAIASLPPNKFKLLSTDLIGKLDSEQAQSVTDGQIAQLSDEQKSALVTAESGDDGDGGDGGDGVINPSNKPSDNGKCFVLTDISYPSVGSSKITFDNDFNNLSFPCRFKAIRLWSHLASVAFAVRSTADLRRNDQYFNVTYIS